MKQGELEQCLKILVPGAGFAIWSEPPPFPPEADLSTTRSLLSGFTVCWARANSQPCPLQPQVDAVVLPPPPVPHPGKDIVALLDNGAITDLKAKLGL